MKSNLVFIGLCVYAMLLAAALSAAHASPQNPQRISRGLRAPVYVNNTGVVQTNTHGVYVNQTQYNATPVVTTRRLMFHAIP